MGCSPSKADGHTGFEYSSLGYQGMLIHKNQTEFHTTDERKVATENVDNEEKENKNTKSDADGFSVNSGDLIIPLANEPAQSTRPESAPPTEKTSERQCETISPREEINSSNGKRPVSRYERSIVKEYESSEDKNLDKENGNNDNKSLKSDNIIVPPTCEQTLVRPNSEPQTQKAEKSEMISPREEISSAHGRRPVSRYVRSVAEKPESEQGVIEPLEPIESRRESKSSVTRNESYMETNNYSGGDSVTPKDDKINTTEGTESKERRNSTCSQKSSKIIPPVSEIIMFNKSAVSVSENQPDRESRKSSISSRKEPEDTQKPLSRVGSSENGIQREWTTYRNDSFCSSASSVRKNSALSNHGDGKLKTDTKPPSRESLLSCHSAKIIVPPSRESVLTEQGSLHSRMSSRRESKEDKKETMEESWILSGRQSATLKRDLSDTGSVSSQSDQEQEKDITGITGNISSEKEDNVSLSNDKSQNGEGKIIGTEELTEPGLGSASAQDDTKEICPEPSLRAGKESILSDKEMTESYHDPVNSSRRGSASSVQNSATEQYGSDQISYIESSPEKEAIDLKSEEKDFQRNVSNNEEEASSSVKDDMQHEKSSAEESKSDYNDSNIQ